MEPRTGVRGRRTSTGSRSTASTPLQWSRGPESAEGVIRADRVLEAVRASMEPRTGVRGRRAAGRCVRPAASASMEPRTGVRGRARRCGVAWCRRPRFNGAADRSPRKGRTTRRPGSSRTRFNGAADRSPRKDRAIVLKDRSDTMLQWSRGPESAEGVVEPEDEPVGLIASMEPRTGVRGRQEWSEIVFDEFGLQWSRGPESAEGLRKKCAQPVEHLASMEPRTGVRGRVIERTRREVEQLASMEPRTGVRGRLPP